MRSAGPSGQATRRIKLVRPETAVVLISVYVSAEPEARDAAADAFLLKGFTGDELIEVLESTASATASATGPPTAR